MLEAPSHDPAEIAKFAKLAEQWWAPNGAFASLHKLNPARIAFARDAILAHFGKPPGGRQPLLGLRLADLGCGGGIAAEPLARLGAAVTGLDAAPENVGAAAAHAASAGLRIDYRAGLAERLAEQEPGGFDVVTALEIVEHVADLDSFLAACAQLLRPGGLLIVSTINRTAKARALALFVAEKILKWAPEGAHDYEKLVTPEELAHALQGAGLAPRDAIGFVFDPLSRQWRAGGRDVAINYFMLAAKPGSPQ